MKKLVVIFCLLFWCFSYKHNAQDSLSTNPIIFSEVHLGIAFNEVRSLSTGINLNYQVKEHLLTARYNAHIYLDVDLVVFVLIPLPVVLESRTAEEFALLYGQRIIKNGHSFSLSGGLSFNKSSVYRKISDTESFENRDFYLGIPLEANFKLFKKERRRYRIYGIIPIGRPIAYGQSIGLKIFGSISRNSYVGLGLTWGSGFHKQY